MDRLVDWALFFNNDMFIVMLSICGLYFADKKAFFNTLFVSLFAISFGAYLKSIFQIPLNPVIEHAGWSYPSGHTIFHVAFWGSLLIQLRSPWILACLLTLTLTNGYGMVYKEYHNWIDIIAGICAAGLVLVPFYYWIRYYNKKLFTFGFITVVSSLFIYSVLLPRELLDYTHILFVIGNMIGILISCKYFAKLLPNGRVSRVVTILFASTIAYYAPKGLYLIPFITGATMALIPLVIAPATVRLLEKKFGYHQVSKIPSSS